MRALVYAALLAPAWLGAPMANAALAADSIRFAVIAGLPPTLPGNTATRALLDSLQRTPGLKFAVFDGALRRPGEPCADQTFSARRTLLDASAVPLVIIPGQHDWQDCDAQSAGGFNPLERLDFVRQMFFDRSQSPGGEAMHVVRQSDLPRFRQYHENLRWEAGGIAFVTLNVPDGNNHYSSAGGRNGEFEDRTVANAFWLRHVGEYAKRRKLKSIVILIDADPDFERYTKHERFAWWGLGRPLPRDGYVELKHTLVDLSRGFSGTVLLIHGTSRDVAPRVRIDQPLRDEHSARVMNFTRISMARAGRALQWLDIRADSARWPIFHVSEHWVTGTRRFTAPLIAPSLSSPAALQQSSAGANVGAGSPGAALAWPDSSADIMLQNEPREPTATLRQPVAGPTRKPVNAT